MGTQGVVCNVDRGYLGMTHCCRSSISDSSVAPVAACWARMPVVSRTPPWKRRCGDLGKSLAGLASTVSTMLPMVVSS